MAATAASPDLDAEPRHELERVLNSETFRNSEAVSRLLAYLGEKSLTGEGRALKEFTIGVEAFGKPPDYNPQEDPTVRVLASKLRQKLEAYYRTEGAADPIRIELPKGHYVLRFPSRLPGSTETPAAAATAQARRWKQTSVVLAAMFVATLLLAARWRASLERVETAAARTERAWSPELELFWQPYLETSRPVLMALGTPLFTKLGGSFFRDPRLNQWEEAEESVRVHRVQKALGSPSASAWYNFTGIGEASGAFLLGKLLVSRVSRLSMKRSSALSWEDIGAHNVIFLGSPKFIPQLKQIPFEQDFVIQGGSLWNVHPRPGEPEKFPEIWTPSQAELLEDHALVTRLPGLHGQGVVTMLAASSTQGTWAAVEYVTRAQHARDLIAKLCPGGGRPPKAYQVVIRAKFQDEVPIEISYVTHRVLESPAVKSDR